VSVGWRAILPRRLRTPRAAKPSFAAILRLPLLLPLLPLLFLVNLVDRALFLIVPLCVAAPGMGVRSVETTTGIVMSGGAFAGAASAYVFGRVAGRRAHATRLLLVSLLAGAFLIVLMALVHEVFAFTVSRILLGLAVGGAPTLAYAIAGDHIPDTVRASSYALLSSTAMLGASLGPTMTGVLSAFNLRAPLWAGGVTYVLLAAQTVALDRRRRRHDANLAGVAA
jgi:MFS family permease